MNNKVLGGVYTCSNCGKHHRTSTVCNCVDKKESTEQKAEKIPTAKEFLKNNANDISFEGKQMFAADVTPEMLVKFAKLHVQAALEAASEKAQWRPVSFFASEHLGKNSCEVDKESILNAYPLTNIV